MTASPLTAVSLRHLPVFAGLPDASLDWLLRVGSVRRLPTRGALSSLEAADGERYCFVLDGAVAITLLAEQGVRGDAFSPKTAAAEYVGYLEQGACFSDGFLVAQDGSPSSRIDCVATHATTLLQVQTSYVVALGAQHEEWSARLAQRLRAEREQFIAHRDPSRRVVQDFFLRQNYSSSTVVRATRLDQCLSCDKCIEACAARHGTPRALRTGARLGRLLFPVACRTCDEKPCLSTCRRGALVSEPTSGEVRILETCTGCGLCAQACPNEAIFIVDREGPARPSLMPGRAPYGMNTGGERSATAPVKRRPRVAIKCDNCADYPDRACLSACPTGALVEMAPEQLFVESGSDSSTQSRRFSDAPFLAGLTSRSGLSRTLHRLLVAFLLLTLLGFGVEVFLRATQPEVSLSGHFVKWAGVDWSVTFQSGRGLGHWLGYIGTSAMLIAVLYSLRTRVRFFSRVGRQSVWLSLHVWLGLIGGVLVTYHSALKLDRWASIACILIWIILLTGVVGRYLHGRLHAGVGLAEFELSSLRAQLARWSPPHERSPALRTLIADLPQAAPRSPWLVAMIWHELRDRWLLLTLRMGDARRLVARDERRRFLESVARWAANRRQVRYYLGVEALLRHWNIVHIVLAIVMFVLAGIHIVYGFIYKAV